MAKKIEERVAMPHIFWPNNFDSPLSMDHGLLNDAFEQLQLFIALGLPYWNKSKNIQKSAI